jgi:predicted RNase H-like nuclease (RuvC/YqgF family)
MKKKIKVADFKSVTLYYKANGNGQRCTSAKSAYLADGADGMNSYIYSSGYVSDLEKEIARLKKELVTRDRSIAALDERLAEHRSNYDAATQRERDAYQKIQEDSTRIEELETKLKMQKPLKEFRVLYGEGYEEVVEAHIFKALCGTSVRMTLHDGTFVAEFVDVQSVIEEE